MGFGGKMDYMKTKIIKLKKLVSSFKNAFEGLRIAFWAEQSFRIQLAIAGLVVILMFCFPLHSLERVLLFLTIGVVLGMELLNSQLEKILDFLQPDHDPRIKKIKDLSAAAVFVAVLSSVIVGLFIFIPYLL